MVDFGFRVSALEAPESRARFARVLGSLRSRLEAWGLRLEGSFRARARARIRNRSTLSRKTSTIRLQTPLSFDAHLLRAWGLALLASWDRWVLGVCCRNSNQPYRSDLVTPKGELMCATRRCSNWVAAVHKTRPYGLRSVTGWYSRILGQTEYDRARRVSAFSLRIGSKSKL
jgi:hypothetical protein